MDFMAWYYQLYMPQFLFILITCGSAFLTPFRVSGECTGITYLRTIRTINVIEIVTVVFLFSRFQRYEPASLFKIYNAIAMIQILFIVTFIYNNIITARRCKTIGLKRYNFMIPGLQFIKSIGFISCIFLFIKKLDRAGTLSLIEGAPVWIPLVIFITLTSYIQTAYLQKDERNENELDTLKIDNIIKYIILFLIIIEMMIAISAIITYANYDRFWKINSYVYTWFWLDGFTGIVLFVFGLCYMDKIVFKKEYIGVLVIPLLSSFLGFIGVVIQVINPYYDAGIHVLQELCYVIGFPAMIIFFLQERYKINRFLIGAMAVLTPLARLVVFVNIWAR